MISVYCAFPKQVTEAPVKNLSSFSLSVQLLFRVIFAFTSFLQIQILTFSGKIQRLDSALTTFLLFWQIKFKGQVFL